MKNKDKKIFGSYNNLPNLGYEQMIVIILNHYKKNEKLQGHISFSEMKKNATQMNSEEIKRLFDQLIYIETKYNR